MAELNKEDKIKTLISLSGGLDSSSLLGFYKSKGHSITCVSFNYGSKHNRYENQAAKRIAKYYESELIEIDLTTSMQAFKSDLLLSGGEIPEGHYKADSMKSTVVPARNMIFISYMAGLAESLDIGAIGIGIHAGDHHIYPDCRPLFFEAIKKTVRLATETEIQLLAPFIMLTKEEIVKKGTQYNVPFHLTRTCYKNQEQACGVCGSCIERLGAFEKNGIPDPIQYQKTN